MRQHARPCLSKRARQTAHTHAQSHGSHVNILSILALLARPESGRDTNDTKSDNIGTSDDTAKAAAQPD